MRIIKLSNQVFGFDTKDGCVAYFKHVLPWQKERFNIIGDGAHIAGGGLATNETVVFSYEGFIVAIAKVEKIITDTSNSKVVAIQLKNDSRRVFADSPKLKDLEQVLLQHGYTKKIMASQGWNIIDNKYEEIVVDFLINHEWKQYTT